MKALAKCYADTYQSVILSLPAWKRIEVQKDLQEKRDSRILDEFVRCVIQQAEAIQLSNDTVKVPTKKTTDKPVPTPVIKR